VNGFQNASFVPFEHYVRQAKRAQSKTRREFGSRRIDFTDAVIVSETPMADVPEFADTLSEFPDTEPMPLPEVTHVAVDIAVTGDVISAADTIAAKLARAKHFVAAQAFAECLHAGYFPPGCQACGR